MLDLFSHLTKNEIIEFEKFIKSPYYNTDKTIVKIFENLKKINANYNSDLNSETELFKELNLDNSKRNRLSKQFRSLLKYFLKLKEFEKDENTNMMYELRALREKKFTTHYKKKLNEFIKIFDNKFKRDENYYSNRIIIEDDYYNFTINEKALDYPDILNTKRDNIIYNFYFQLLHCYNDMILHEEYAGKKFDLKFPYLNEILNDIKLNFEKIQNEHPNICIIYYIISIQLSMRKNQSTIELEKLYLKYLEANLNKFDKTQLFHYYLYIVNYYILMLHKGNYDYRQKLFDIYFFQEKNDFLLLNNEINAESFRDVVSIATSTGNLDWAQYFIEKYKKLLNYDKNKDFINLSYAKIYFIKKNYNKSISHLILVGSRNISNYVSAKIIFCKIYYEQKNISAIEFELDNLRKLEKRNKKINELNKSSIDNFTKYIKQLIKINTLEFMHDKKFQELAEFSYDEINKLHYFIPEKNWFLEKFQSKFKNK
ncbi:MAG TPA: hypothetical protein VHP32_03585 [Ignavibacteria bacterium]|nr:hypothetical protein [Ignavibacteria bacterium]